MGSCKPPPASPLYLERLSRRLADQGRLIEAGWAMMRLKVVSPYASPVQIQNMRMAFMAGAQHLFSSILVVLDSGAPPTEADIRRMELIHHELEVFAEELALRIAKPMGES